MIGSGIGVQMQRIEFTTIKEWTISGDWQDIYTVTLRGENGMLEMTAQFPHYLDTLLQNALDAWKQQHPTGGRKPNENLHPAS